MDYSRKKDPETTLCLSSFALTSRPLKALQIVLYEAFFPAILLAIHKAVDRSVLQDNNKKRAR